MKIENRSRKFDGIVVWRIRTIPFSSNSAYDSVAYDQVKTSLSKSQAEVQELACPTGAIGALIGVFDLTRETHEEDWVNLALTLACLARYTLNHKIRRAPSQSH